MINFRSKEFKTANEELARRGIGGSIGQCLLAVLIVLSTPFTFGFRDAAHVFLTIIFFVSAFRLGLCLPGVRSTSQTQPIAWRWTFRVLFFIGSVGWGMLSRQTLLLYGIESQTSFIVVMLTIGMGATVCSALGPSPFDARLMLLPMSGIPMYTFLTHPNPQFFLLAVMLFVYLIFLQLQITIQTRMHRRMREKESQYEILSDTTFEGVAIHLEGRFVEVNAAFARLCGYERSELIGADIFKTIAPESLEMAKRILAEKREIAAGLEYVIIRKDGTSFHAEVNSRNLFHQNKTFRVVCLRDLTKQRETEKEQAALSKLREDAAIESGRLKSEFLANMSHEIRTPLNGIVVTAELLLDTSLNEEQARFVKTLRDSSDILMTILNDILDFSKIEAGKLDLEHLEFSVTSTVESAADLLGVKANHKGLSLAAFISPEIPMKLVGDAGRLSQILLNLIGNAIKFTAKGSITVKAELEREEANRVWVRFSVKDSGIGLEEGAAAMLFRPFTQADGSTARKFGGTGLGLSISKHLVQMMGGDISVKSELGKGSEFFFHLPLARSTSLHPVINLPAEWTNLRVALVSLDEGSGEATSSYLRSWGLSFSHLDQKEFFEKLPSAKLDVAVVGEKFYLENFSLFPTLLTVVVLSSRQPMREIPGINHRSRIRLYRPLKQSDLYNSILCATRSSKISAPLSVTEAPHAPLRDAEREGSKGKVLIAEDNTTNQMLAVANLTKLGYSTQVVANGLEVLAILQTNEFDLILMDCQMPEMDGFTATQKIRQLERETGRHLPIVALTANAMKQDEKRCREAGMDDYLSKPVRREFLAKVLARWIPS